ncbi:MAG: prolipoprotein diacylglyceryl transferase [Rickettsiales bacterium]|jgi:phosphatidylglycerol:prolipoprotein diacylglycerol transferase|nr:prolipoprotein diacylglyceryl transferase [Rickettsiales bacterium]
MILIHPVSPVAINIFGLQIRWYAIAYIAAFIAGFWLVRRLQKAKNYDKKYYDDLFAYLILGVIIGGRLGYVLFYNLPFFLQNPWEIPMLWHGGMSFHGGLAGVISSVFLFARHPRHSGHATRKGKITATLSILDSLAVAAPIGLFFGRIANFINMEVMGRATSRPWGVVFAGSGGPARHPSPLYEAGLEGIALFIIMLLLWRAKLRGRPGALSGVFGILYGVFRIFCEQFREPDIQVGFLFGTSWLTMGTILSFAMIIAGAGLLWQSRPTSRNGRAPE